MLRHATTLTVIGFVLLFLGLVSLILNYVGVDIFFLAWIYRLGIGVSIAIRLLMIIVGFTLIYVAQTDWDREEA